MLRPLGRSSLGCAALAVFPARGKRLQPRGRANLGHTLVLCRESSASRAASGAPACTYGGDPGHSQQPGGRFGSLGGRFHIVPHDDRSIREPAGDQRIRVLSRRDIEAKRQVQLPRIHCHRTGGGQVRTERDRNQCAENIDRQGDGRAPLSQADARYRRVRDRVQAVIKELDVGEDRDDRAFRARVRSATEPARIGAWQIIKFVLRR